jgi:hypothetical protein
VKCERCNADRVLLLTSWAECDCAARPVRKLHRVPVGTMLGAVTDPAEMPTCEVCRAKVQSMTSEWLPRTNQIRYTFRCHGAEEKGIVDREALKDGFAPSLICAFQWDPISKSEEEERAAAFEAGANRVRWIMAREPELEQRMGHRAHVLARLTREDWLFMSGEEAYSSLRLVDAGLMRREWVTVYGGQMDCQWSITKDGAALRAALRKHGLPAFEVES